MSEQSLTEKELEAVRLKLRLCEVSRWGVVVMTRPQSVAEHSYRVAILAKLIYQHLTATISHNSFDKQAVPELALEHDFEELFGGDMCTLLKRAVEAIEPGIYMKAVHDITSCISPEARSILDDVDTKQRAAKGSVVQFCVKLADMIESLMYLSDYGTGYRKAEATEEISERTAQYVAAYKVKEPRLRWDAVAEIMHGMCPKQFASPKTYAFQSAYLREGED